MFTSDFEQILREGGIIMADILSLPDELLIMVLSFCESSDFVQVSQVCRKLNDISCDRKLVRVLNFHYHRGLNQSHLKMFLSNRCRAENVTSIDMTSCYWLTSSCILNLLSHLRNAESLLVADTALLPNHLRQLLLRLTRVKRLSWTWHKEMSVDGLDDALQKMQFLYICIPKSQCLNSVVKWVNKCVELKELWINNFDFRTYPRCNKPIELDALENIVLYPSTFFPIIRTKCSLNIYWLSNPPISTLGADQIVNVQAIYAKDWGEISHSVALGSQNIEIVYCSGSAGSDVVQILPVLKRLKALNIVLSDSLFSDDLLSTNFNLNELSISAADNAQECSTNFCDIVSACSKLKSLSLPLHAFVCVWTMFEPSPSGCSSRRVSRAIETLPSGVKTPFGKMVDNTPLIEVFEMGLSCKSFEPKLPAHLVWDLLSLSFIANWKHLTSLTLANIPIVNGKFFSPVLKNCKQLKVLKIIDLGPQANCIYTLDLCNALPFCRVLQDFHWTQSYVGKTSRLWTAFQKIPSLQRIALCLDGMSELEEVDVYQTMDRCPLLCFLHVATGTTKVKSKRIKQNLISRWLKVRQHLCVWFGWPDEALESIESYPYVHAGEMLHKIPQVMRVPMPAHGFRFLSFGKRDWAPHI